SGSPLLFCCSRPRRPPSSTRFPYTTLFRSLDAFKKLQTLRPDDPRGEQLYVQTLFDGDRYEILAAMYEKEHRERPTDVAPINGLDRKSTRLNSSHVKISYAVFCLNKKKKE